MPQMMDFEIAGRKLQLVWGRDAFQPVTVTQRIAELVELQPHMHVLDLGCGVGPLAVHAGLEGVERAVAVDIMPQAVGYARQNVERYNLQDRVDVRCGDLFAPVQGETFDVIINDVSGIAEQVARLSGWYPDPIPTGGDDGTDVVTRMLTQARTYLRPDGVLYFATSSLSDDEKIIACAKDLYGEHVHELRSFRIPFNEVLADRIEDLRKLREAGTIDFEERRSRMLWTLRIFRVDATRTDTGSNSPKPGSQTAGR